MNKNLLNYIDISDVQQQDWGEGLCLLRLPGSNFEKNLLICVEVNIYKDEPFYRPLTDDKIPKILTRTALYAYDLRKNNPNRIDRCDTLYYDLHKALENTYPNSDYYIKLGSAQQLRNQFVTGFKEMEIEFMKKMLKLMVFCNHNQFDIMTVKGTHWDINSISFYYILCKLLHDYKNIRPSGGVLYNNIYLYEFRKFPGNITNESKTIYKYYP